MARPFSFAASADAGSSVRVKLQNLRKFLWGALLLSAVFAVWSWFRPYAWNPDPGARCKVIGVQVTQDQSYAWVEAHLKVNPGMIHDLQKPVSLAVSGHDLEPADTTFGGTEGTGTTDIWLKFWLENKYLAHPMTLRLNDGKLIIKANEGAPRLGSAKSKYFVSIHW